MNSENQIKLTAISIPDLAKLLKHAGSVHASEEAIRDDVEKGAPVNQDGTINLIHYTAWLLKEAGQWPAPRENTPVFSVPANAGINEGGNLNDGN